MTAYVILIRDKPPHDPAELAEYARKTQEGPRNPKLSVLALYGATEALEGGPAPDGVVVLGFPTMADAQEWYREPRYQEAARHRLAGANYRSFIVEGF